MGGLLRCSEGEEECSREWIEVWMILVLSSGGMEWNGKRRGDERKLEVWSVTTGKA